MQDTLIVYDHLIYSRGSNNGRCSVPQHIIWGSHDTETCHYEGVHKLIGLAEVVNIQDLCQGMTAGAESSACLDLVAPESEVFGPSKISP